MSLRFQYSVSKKGTRPEKRLYSTVRNRKSESQRNNQSNMGFWPGLDFLELSNCSGLQLPPETTETDRARTVSIFASSSRPSSSKNQFAITVASWWARLTSWTREFNLWAELRSGVEKCQRTSATEAAASRSKLQIHPD